MSSDAPPADEMAENTQEETAVEDTPTVEAVETEATVHFAPKQAITATVDRIELQGAIVDAGNGIKGLLHISQLSDEPVKNVADVLAEGQEITAYVLKFNESSKRLDLTLIEPLDLTWDELKVNQIHHGTVVRLEKFGAFVDIGAERPGLVHVSELTTNYVSAPEEVVSVGQEIEAKVIGVNRRKKQIDLSVKAIELDQQQAAIEEATVDEEDLPTAMEVALRQAMEDSDMNFPPKEQSRKKRNKKGKKRRSQQDDIISRTLRFHDDP